VKKKNETEGEKKNETEGEKKNELKKLQQDKLKRNLLSVGQGASGGVALLAGAMAVEVLANNAELLNPLLQEIGADSFVELMQANMQTTAVVTGALALLTGLAVPMVLQTLKPEVMKQVGKQKEEGQLITK